ncbi:MAG TPA: c-type cytochrome [Alcanivoracaceae bacterium]|nr:c-type cytochrome [Alcanivoracaceae bacterium]
MSIRKHARWGLALGALLLVNPLAATAEADPEKGKAAAVTCLACHGPDGVGNAAAGYPRLDILTAGYLTKQIKDFKTGANDSAIMKPLAAMIADEDIQHIAAYYASQDAEVKADASDEALMKRGEQLALRGDWDNYIPACKSCHGHENKGVGDTFPALAGQHASYITTQIKAWKTGARRNDPQNLMLAIAERLTDEDVEAVAAYLAAQDAK